MRKLQTYWYSLRASLSDPEYYFSLRSSRVLFSIQFFVFSLFLIAIFEIPNWSLHLIPAVTTMLRSETASVISQLPEDAVFSYSGGKLVTHGMNVPLTISATQKAQDLGYPKNLIEITGDETTTSAAFTLTPTRALVNVGDAQATEATYKDIFGDDEGSLARDQIRTGVNTFLDMVLTYRWQLALAMSVVGFFISLCTGVFTIALYSILVQVIGWVLGVRITYKFALRWGLHIFPIALAIQEISSLLTTTGSFPILIVSYIAIATLILWVGRSGRPTIVFNE